ncbi:MAG TPA: hypothetical protein DCP90_04510 [Clostridiales bacterium]|nr:MAG: hypothetical protein A2Y22_06755 [Clostridiales bacterium GWD2_32_59]HAN09858.1 hypothetical protein [Clostridiales bacterium]
MFVIKKNQIIIVALVAMIAIAGYFNYVDTSNEESKLVLQDATDIKAPTDIDNKSNIDNTENKAKPDTLDTEGMKVPKEVASDNEQIGSAVFVNNSFDEEVQETFFLQAKMNREQTRAERKDWLTQVINNDNVATDKKGEATDELIDMQKRIEKENSIESMIEAKGFSEVYVRIDDDSVDVVVNVENLSEQQIAQIAEITSRKTGLPISKIKITPLKKEAK